MSKSTKLSRTQWARLKSRLTNDYSPSVMFMRSCMRDVLGFTPRDHSTYTEKRGTDHTIYLDWYSEPKRTMFLLKYGEYLENI
jgi:hypothetical protein